MSLPDSVHDDGRNTTREQRKHTKRRLLQDYDWLAVRQRCNCCTPDDRRLCQYNRPSSVRRCGFILSHICTFAFCAGSDRYFKRDDKRRRKEYTLLTNCRGAGRFVATETIGALGASTCRDTPWDVWKWEASKKKPRVYIRVFRAHCDLVTALRPLNTVEENGRTSSNTVISN